MNSLKRWQLLSTNFVRGDNLILGSNSSPRRTFTSLVIEHTQYECVQTCYPIGGPRTIVDICANICAFNPSASAICAQCPDYYVVEPKGQPPPLPSLPPPPQSQPPSTGQGNLCCYPDIGCYPAAPGEICPVNPPPGPPPALPPPSENQLKVCCDAYGYCYNIAAYLECPGSAVCYEPCDAPCTYQCQVNPACPNRCIEVENERRLIEWKYWLVQKLREIKIKYKKLVEACILRTLQAREAEEKVIIEESYQLIGRPELKYYEKEHLQIFPKH